MDDGKNPSNVTSVELDPTATQLGELPRLYLASPLTALPKATRRQLQADVTIVKQAVTAETDHDRVPDEAWPVAVYAPVDHTPPWGKDGLSPGEVYRRNLDQIHHADALIILAESGGSTGVGQELEWSVRLQMPVLYLTADDTPSRQISGTPGFISPRTYNGDAATLANHVRNFLRLWKPLILDGPRRRASRKMRFEAITLRLRGAWQSCPNRTDVAAQTRADITYIELALSDPRFVAVMATDTLLTLAHHLNVSLHATDPAPAATLEIPALRALMAAAAEDGWDDPLVKRLIHEGHFVALTDGATLNTITGWRAIRDTLTTK